MDFIKEIDNLLRPYIEVIAKYQGDRNALGRMQKLMEAVGNPQDRLKIVHIAGTSGKTSTSYYLSSMLSISGSLTGLAVSPHVDKVTERLQINTLPISDADFLKYLKEFIDLTKEVPLPTYFEFLYGFALWVFAKLKVDYAIIETGAGGLYDATNIANNPDKVCVITDIGFDHMDLLGNDLRQITFNKAGIIHQDNVAVTYAKPNNLMQVIEDRISLKPGSRLEVVDEALIANQHYVSSLALYQRRNWFLAFKVYEYICHRDSLKELSQEELLTTQQTYIPGRVDVVSFASKLIVMDGAHNEQKLTTLFETIKTKYPDQKATVVIAHKNSKRMDNIASALKGVAELTIATEFKTTKDLKAHAIEADQLAKSLSVGGLDNVLPTKDFKEALKVAFNSKNKLIIITGSFFLLSQVRAELQKQKQ